jgi:beta-lactam-binding protein with PASTA domain
MSDVTSGEAQRPSGSGSPPAPPSPPDKSDTKETLIGCLSIVAVIVVVIIVASAIFGGDDKPRDPVPDVALMNVGDAKKLLKAAGYDVKEDDQADSLDFKSSNNWVCSTDPGPGKVEEGEIKIVIKSDLEDCRSDEQKAAAKAEEQAHEPQVSISFKRSYCEQLGTVYDFATVGTQVKVILALRNKGDTDATDVAYRIRRTYQNGKTVDPLGDTVVDAEVPADGKWHYQRINYGVGANYRVVGCTLHSVDAPGIDSDEEFELRIENSIIE